MLSDRQKYIQSLDYHHVWQESSHQIHSILTRMANGLIQNSKHLAARSITPKSRTNDLLSNPQELVVWKRHATLSCFSEGGLTHKLICLVEFNAVFLLGWIGFSQDGVWLLPLIHFTVKVQFWNVLVLSSNLVGRTLKVTCFAPWTHQCE